MAEAQKITAISAPAVLAATPTVSSSEIRPPAPPPPSENSYYSRFKVPIFATLGATFGFLTGTGLYGEVSKEPLVFLFIVSIIGLAAYLFLDPIMELLLHALGAEHHEELEDRKTITTLLVVVATVVLSALHHSFGESLADEGGRLRALIMLIVCSATVGAVTLVWTYGARRSPSRAGLYGGLTGILVGGGFGALALLVLYANHSIPAPHADVPAAMHYTAYAIGAIGFPSFLWLVLGLLGGLAIDKHWGGRPTNGIFWVLGGVSLAVVMVIGLMRHSMPDPWLIAAQLVFLNLGWGLGPFLQREACDPHLDPSGRYVRKVAEREKGGGRHKSADIVPFPHPLEDDPAFDRDDRRLRQPAIVFLPREGSRLWALVVLVILLGVGAWAYVRGVFRTDAEIVAEVESRFLADSGLHQKLLAASSTDHIVTLTGNVEDAIQHNAAVEEASSVRGVQRLVDSLHIVPLAPAPLRTKTVTNTNTVLVPVGPALPPPVIARPLPLAVPVPLIKFGKSHPVTQKPAAAPGPDAKPHHGFFHFLKKDKKDKKDKNTPKNNNQQ